MNTLSSKALSLILLVAAGVAGFTLLAAGPEPGVPPRPFLPDYFFGTVLVQGMPPVAGTQLMACIDDCDMVYAGTPVLLGEMGSFRGLAVGPKDPSLLDHTVRFYLVNEHGRIPASESATFAGALELRRINLTFHRPLSSLSVAATLPAVGDSLVAGAWPKVALALGGAIALAGIALVLVARRREFWWGRPSASGRTVQPKV
ncbi:MAG: hypothetical protein EXR54_10310 [Dehalococcoidia bacterium]|nr:hypothetical protein [Dehalococcoidia bacterium]MSQ17921.1 hypothetical protein [Dehalococcoidia bacterium]